MSSGMEIGTAFVFLLWVAPLVINCYVVRKDAEHLLIILLCSLFLSWLVTAVLMYKRMINTPEFLVVRPDGDEKSMVAVDEKLYGISLICTTTTRAVELYSLWSNGENVDPASRLSGREN